ncbi:MAG TPA: sigma-70 family RNA polymerase sigma factor [Anaerolineales bacterium]|nr:sigma-70 family RNA polymerase sigma factor [Anaerolineales bacterium]
MTVRTEDIERSSAQASQELAQFESAFHEHWHRVYGVLFRLVGDHAEAEDLALEAFWRLYRQPRQPSDNLGGWLYRVAMNLGFNALRARKRRARYEEQAGRLESTSAANSDPAETTERTDQRARVRAVLAQMQPRAAQMLILRFSGFSYAEIAAAIGVAPASIGTLLARAEGEFEKTYQKLEGV